MSHSTAKGKVIGRFTIGFDDETKASIADLKTKLEAVPHRLSFGNVMPIGGLLAAMQEAAANDANGVVHHGENVKPELKQLGQWVFEGQDEKFQSAAVDGDGRAFLYQDKKSALIMGQLKRFFLDAHHDFNQIDGVFDTTNWQNSAINRETFNDVDYLSETVPDINGVEANFIIIDELQNDWLSESVPQITQADMQLIFIKNLSEVLIQRMHSMNRFSEDDYAIGGDKLMAWDILIYEPLNSYAVLIDNRQKPKIADLLFFWDTGAAADANWNTDSGAFAMLRKITEDELPAFRAALEACYA